MNRQPEDMAWELTPDQPYSFVLTFASGDGFRMARVKSDGCIDYYRYHNEPYDGSSPTQLEDYLHICNIDEEIARLQALKAAAEQAFKEQYGLSFPE